MFIPVGAKHLDPPGMVELGAPSPLWRAGEGQNPEIFGATFSELSPYAGPEEGKQRSAVEWLLGN